MNEKISDWLKSEQLDKNNLTIKLFNVDLREEFYVNYVENIIANQPTAIKKCRRIVQQIESVLKGRYKIQLSFMNEENRDYVFIFGNGMIYDPFENKEIKFK